MNEILNKIADTLNMDELDDFVKFIWLYDKNNIDFIIDTFSNEIRVRLETISRL